MRSVLTAALPGRPPHESLTQRERDVLIGIGNGEKSKDIAKRLFLSPQTVSSYRARVFMKLDLHNKAQIVRYCIENGLLGDSPISPQIAAT